MDRRHFLKHTAKTGSSLGFYSYLGYQAFGSSTAHATVKVFRDLQMTCGVGTTKTFAAENFLTAGDVTIAQGIVEGNHTHNVVVTAAQINMIIAGQVIRFPSAQGSDNSGPHNVTIDPAQVVAAGNSIEAFEAEGADIIGVVLGKGDAPFLYVSGQNLKPGSLSYCIGGSACQTPSGKIVALEAYTTKNGQDIFTSRDRLMINNGDLIHVFAETSTGSPVKVIAKVAKI